MRTPLATRRRGGADLDDLKARLGIQESAPADSTGDSPAADPSEAADGSEAPQNAPEDASAATAQDAPTALTSDATESAAPRPEAAAARPAPAPRPSPKPAAAPVPSPSASDLEDFASAVAEDKAAPDGPFEDLSADIAPRSEVPVLAVLGTIAVLLIGAFLGLMAGSGNTGRKINNARLDGAAELLATIGPVAVQIATLNGQLQGIDADARYNPDFEARLREMWENSRPEVRTSALTSSGGSIVLAVDPDLSRRVIEYINATQQLSVLVEDHLRRTERDMAEIQNELQNVQDERAVGIVFSFERVVTAYNALYENPAEAAWAPVVGERVFLDSMEAVRMGEAPAEGEDDARPLGYRATGATGQSLEVPVTDLVFVRREQMMPAVSNETPISRYRARTAHIKNAVEAIAQQQGAITEQLESLSNEPRVFAF
jgi:hypothetical protein